MLLLRRSPIDSVPRAHRLPEGIAGALDDLCESTPRAQCCQWRALRRARYDRHPVGPRVQVWPFPCEESGARSALREAFSAVAISRAAASGVLVAGHRIPKSSLRVLPARGMA